MVVVTCNKHIQKLTSNVCGLRSDSNSAVKKFAFPSLRHQTPAEKWRYTIINQVNSMCRAMGNQKLNKQTKSPVQDAADGLPQWKTSVSVKNT